MYSWPPKRGKPYNHHSTTQIILIEICIFFFFNILTYYKNGTKWKSIFSLVVLLLSDILLYCGRTVPWMCAQGLQCVDSVKLTAKGESSLQELI